MRASTTARFRSLRAALQTIADYGDEDNEWDAVDRYARVRSIARAALPPAHEGTTDLADARAPGPDHPHGGDRGHSSSS